MIIPLYDVYEGAIGAIFWLEKTDRIVSTDEEFKIRQKAISDMLNGAIQAASYSGANQSMDVQTAMQRGWNEGNKQIETLQNGTEMKSLSVMVGIPNLIDVISDIEISPNFRGWVNPYLIKEIKEHYNNII